MWKFTPAPHKGDVHRRRTARAVAKVIRREERAIRRAERAASGEKGAPIDWSAAVEQFPSAFDDSNPIVAGVGRTLSRGL